MIEAHKEVSMIIPIELPATIYDEGIGGDLNTARINLTEDRIEWIKKMARIVKRNKIAHIADYDGSASYLKREDGETDPDKFEETDYRTECDMIIINDNEFHWKGYIKHTEAVIETDEISITALNDLIKFYKETPLSQCPKYMNDEDYSKREIAKQRMKGLSPE